MKSNDLPSERLDRFLAARGLTRDAVLAALGEPFGPPLLVVITGSILNGVGNERSDVDVNIVVERKVTRIPLGAFARSVIVDPTYFVASEVEGWVKELRDQPWPPSGVLGLEQWSRRYDQLLHATRFRNGVPLVAQETWARWATQFHEPWLAEQIAQWWRIEAVRKRLASRWLADGNPLLASQRGLDAVLAALESRAAAAGQDFFGPKWLSEKLRMIDDGEGLALLRTILRAPATAQEARDYIAQCEAALDRYGPADGGRLVAQVSYLPGVETCERDGRMIVSRGKLRSLELAAAPRAGELIWEGTIDGRPPPAVTALLAANLIWLAVVELRP